MSQVYQRNETVLDCFKWNSHYVGFTQGSEKHLVTQEPLKVRSHTINPGDKIAGFESGSGRTSYILTKGVYMTYFGRFELEHLFELSNENREQQGNLFEEKPRWFLAFGHIESMNRFLMLSAPGQGWDVVPKQILRYDG